MPKKSTKSKSKRLSLRQKHKILRKVKEHHRKKRKDANRAKRDGKKPPKVKDPGIPSQWPFKDELIKELAWQKSQILFKEKQAKEDRKRARQVRDEAGSCGEGMGGGGSQTTTARSHAVYGRRIYSQLS